MHAGFAQDLQETGLWHTTVVRFHRWVTLGHGPRMYSCLQMKQFTNVLCVAYLLTKLSTTMTAIMPFCMVGCPSSLAR